MNPFNLTKSADMTDEMIHNFWVSSHLSIRSKISSRNPIFLLGGKGSGKTHLFRHYSYPLQKLRSTNQPVWNTIKENDKYLGIYYRCKGLQADRFSGKGYSAEVWREYFEYSFELTLGHELVYILGDLIENPSDGNIIASKISDLLDLKSQTLKDLEADIANLIRKLNRAISNTALGVKLQDNPHAKLLASRGDLIFGIPKIVTSQIPDFSTIPFIYLIDEIENFSEEHQIYVNTLIREKEPEVSFKIGCRRYGIKSKMTLSGGEELIEGSEKETIVLDDLYRESETKYFQFLLDLTKNRVEKSELSSIPDELEKLFTKPNYKWNSNFFRELVGKSKKNNSPHMEKFAKALAKTANSHEIIETLSCKEYPLLELVNIYNFQRYSRDSKYKSIKPIEIARKVASDCHGFINSDDTDRDTKTRLRLNHYQNNFAHRLSASYSNKSFYTGIDNIILMSEGMPRNFLQILKVIFDWGYQLDQNPLLNPKIPAFNDEVQSIAIRSSSQWFFDDIRECEDRSKLKESIRRLGELLKLNHYAELPKECSCISFSLHWDKLSKDSQSLINLAVDYSFIIKADDTPDKNHNSTGNKKYRISRMLCPLWDLPLASRGTKQLNEDEANIIWDSKNYDIEDFNMLRDKWEKETTYMLGERENDQGSLL